jgi:competence protein ComEC
MSLAATLSTGPLMAYDFERVSLTSPAANLAALPAVAPAMWLGMVVSALGQIPGVPVEPLNWVNSLLIGAIAQFASWLGDPSWSVVNVRLSGLAGLAGSYAVLGVLWLGISRFHRRASGLSLRVASGLRLPRLVVIALVLVLGWTAVAGGTTDRSAPPHRDRLVVRVLDIGQGDAILLSPADGDPVLVDGGPADDDLPRRLHALGVRRLAAVVATHDQADHVGGLSALRGVIPVGRLIEAGPLRAVHTGARPMEVSAGDILHSGSLTLRVLWPPRALASTGSAEQDPNLRAIVLLVEVHSFRALLTSDAEAEAADVHPGPIDLLKVAHHGSADAGLPALLRESRPRLAVISVGRGNPYGHPTSETLSELGAAQVPVLRTDRDGTVAVHVGERGWTVETGH